MSILNKKFFFLFLLLVTFPLFSVDICKVYPDEYKKALYLKQQYQVLFANSGVEDTSFYISLVFPEMIRYNQIQDGLETLLNTISYTTINEFSGYSIGPFQIKPNCALEIERIINNSNEFKKKYSLLSNLGTEESFTEKYKRIMRLQQKTYQIEYVLAFVDICIKKYNLMNESKYEQLRVISAAYNIGLLEKVDDFDNFMTIKSFPKGSKSPDSLWNYTELVLDFYDQFREL